MGLSEFSIQQMQVLSEGSPSAEATFKKLKDGSWGLLVNSDSVRSGDTVLTITKAGKQETKVVGKVMWTGNGVSITTIGDSSGASTAPRRGSSGGESEEDLAAKGLVRVNGPRGSYVRKMTAREKYDEE